MVNVFPPKHSSAKQVLCAKIFQKYWLFVWRVWHFKMLFRLNFGGQKFTLVNGISNQHQQQLKANLINNNVDSQINTCSQERTKNERKEKLKLKNCFVSSVSFSHWEKRIESYRHPYFVYYSCRGKWKLHDDVRHKQNRCSQMSPRGSFISNKFELSKLSHCKLKLTMRHAKKQGVEYCRVVVFSFKNANRHLRLQPATLIFLLSLEIRQFWKRRVISHYKKKNNFTELPTVISDIRTALIRSSTMTYLK